MRDFRPFLQVVHVSGLRLAARGSALPGRARVLARWLRAGTTGATEAGATTEVRGRVRELEDAARVHDPAALAAFDDALAALTVEDPVFRRLPTWLVDTGDRSAFGDDDALALGRDALRESAQRALLRARIELHGERDARPALPTGRTPAAHHARLLTRWFPHRWPAPPLTERTPTGALEVQLYALDTVAPPTAHGPRAALAPDALARLAASVQQYAPAAPVRALRLVAAHHPPTALTASPQDLSSGLPPDYDPLAHVRLASHAAALDPPHGQLARDGAPPVLAVGSLLARAAPGAHDRYAQHGAVLRLYYSASRPRAVVIERLVLARAAGLGPYRFVPVPGQADEVAEELVLEV